MITNQPSTVNSFYSNNTGLSQLESPSPKSVFDISSWSWFSWLIFFIVLAFLGFNIFVFLAKGTMTFVDFFMVCVSKIYAFFKYLFETLGSKISSFSSSSSSSPSSSPSSLKPELKITPATEHSNETPTEITKEDKQMNVGTDDDIMKALKRQKLEKNTEKLFPSSQPSYQENKQLKQSGGLSQREEGQDPQKPGQLEPKKMPDDEAPYSADDSYSTIQMSKSSSKSGWCFIGEDRGFRSCIRVGENNKCMSGDIFPSQEICINPNLRV